MTDAVAYLARLAGPLAGPYSDAAKAAYRREVTRADPLAFALIYLRHHLKDKGSGAITLSEVHTVWVEYAKRWAEPVTRAAQQRDAFIAPRSMGKSTWWFLILPLWAAAHGHVKFAAAFADSASQAEAHLATFKRELETNVLLREDYPKLTTPAMRQRGTVVSDNRHLLLATSGFAFAAKGVDSGNLGMKVGDQRPDLIICDDLEPGESNYSEFQAEKRLTTLLDDILPLNIFARVALVGTTVMKGSIVDQLREYAVSQETAVSA